jgi:hypothetical protein
LEVVRHTVDGLLWKLGHEQIVDLFK